MTRQDRGRVQYPDIILQFATLVTFVAVAPWVFSQVLRAAGVVDPFSGTLLRLALPVMVITMIISLGVSARTG